MTQTLTRPSTAPAPAPVVVPQPGRFHLHWFRFGGVEFGSGHSVYRCRCGVARTGF